MNTLRVQVVKTTRTDLLCIHCGLFRAELAVVAPDVDEKDAAAGVHRKCIQKIKARRKRAPDVPGLPRCRKCGAALPINWDPVRDPHVCPELRTEPAPPPTHDDDEAGDGLV